MPALISPGKHLVGTPPVGWPANTIGCYEPELSASISRAIAFGSLMQ
jgi:hypothetical protein